MPSSLHPTRRTVMASGLGLAATVMLPPMTAGARPVGASDRHITFTSWWGPQLLRGEQQGTVVNGAGMRIGRPTGTRAYVDPFASGPSVTYEQASWLSPTVATPFGLQELIASWNVETPGQDLGGDPRREATTRRARCPGGTSWAAGAPRTPMTAARFTARRSTGRRPRWRPSTPTPSTRTTRTGCATSSSRSTCCVPRAPPSPRWCAGSGRWPRACPTGRDRAGQSGRPRRRSRASTCRRSRRRSTWATTRSGTTAARPGARRRRRRWCWRTGGPARGGRDLAWVTPPLDAEVDFAARNVFDYTYDGAGNWPFNTAYAADVRPRGVRHPAALLDRGRAVHPAGHPAGQLRVVREGRARRRRLRHQRSPHGRRRLHRRPATSW